MTSFVARKFAISLRETKCEKQIGAKPGFTGNLPIARIMHASPMRDAEPVQGINTLAMLMLRPKAFPGEYLYATASSGSIRMNRATNINRA